MSMPSRRVPLSSNPNVANSPLRGASALASYAKQKRPHATVQREEPYGQQPAVKKQALEAGSRRIVRSPSKIARPQSHLLSQRSTTRPLVKDRASRVAVAARPDHDTDAEKDAWKKHHRARFPKMVFYFESIPDEVRTKLTKKVLYLGARQESFFSIDVTHVISGRPIPTERPEAQHAHDDKAHEEQVEEQPQTINPSLLDIDRKVPARRRLFEFKGAPARSNQLDDPTKRTKSHRSTDVLHKARELGIKIWSLDKFQTMLSVLLETETPQTSATSRTYNASKSSHEPDLVQLLYNERINGPSDRDPTAVNRDLNFFKGPYIYVWDMDEKQKPIMVREYPKVVSKSDGEWPQFRSVGNGRCPFVEEVDIPDKGRRTTREQDKAQEKARAAKQETVPVLQPPEIPKPKPVIGKRSLTQMEDGHNRVRCISAADIFNPVKPASIKAALAKQDARPENAFISRAPGARLFAGEPVASGLQASNVTSAIRSQMISSTSGIHGAKAGTSKEVHGLQRKVLQKAVPASHAQGASSRRTAEVSMDMESSRSVSLSRQTSKTTRAQEDDSQRMAESKEIKSQAPTMKSKKDLKPGYCENCQDKFRDFDEHILSRKHRRFAENDENWLELDDLLRQLDRNPRFACHDSDHDDF